MSRLVRAIITGFGYKVGVELAKYVTNRLGVDPDKKKSTDEDGDDLPDGITTNDDVEA